MKICVLSHIGNSRNDQEDNVLICDFFHDLSAIKVFSSDCPSFYKEYETSGYHNALLAVSDGMGGHASGEIASYLTVRYLFEKHLEMVERNRSELLKIISELNRQVSNESQSNPLYKGMGATLCGFIYRENKILGFNVGDSRLYRFENGNLQQLSKDHSEGQRLLDLKLLNEEELKSFSNRKAIYKYIGMKTDLVADVFDIEPCDEGTILLLCTDGLTDVLADHEIKAILNSNESLKEKGEDLLNTALERNVGHGDNITIILTEF